jgi:hypothetical protein
MSKKKLAGIIIACTIAIIVVIVLVIPPLLNTPNLEESLRERATQWNNLLPSLRTLNLTKEQAITEIEGFLEPSAARTAKAEEFYTSWAGESFWKEVASSVDDVSIDATKVNGTVRISIVYEWTGLEVLGLKKGDNVTKTQILNWKLIGKVWYRTMEVAEIK